MFRRGIRDAQMRWYAACLVVATPVGIVATTSSNQWVFIGCIGVFVTLISSYGACAATSLNLVTPNELRGAGIAFWAATSGMMGAALGPMLIAALSQRLFHGPTGIGYGMAMLMAICFPIAAVCLVLGFRSMREAVADAESWAT